jgi:Uncharacterised nucleotidyltransferase
MSLAAMHERARHEHARLALERVLAACSDAGIDVLPVKGILTSRLFYRQPAERPIRDIDLRVRPRDLERVERAAAKAGWPLLSRSWAYRTLSFDVLGFLVEFEAHVGPPGLCALPVDDMLRRAHPSIAPLGVPHLQPELHDHAVLLCVNAFKDKLIDAFPGGVRDLEIIATLAEFDRPRFVKLAVDSRVATIAWIVADWLVETRRSDAWRAIREDLRAFSRRPAYVRLFRYAIGFRVPPRQALRVIARAGSDRASDRIAALCVMAVEPIAAAIASRRERGGATGR